MHSDDTTFRRLQEARLVQARTAGDRLMLDDATLAAALDGSRPLTAGERAALQASPLTVRRLRHLALHAKADPAVVNTAMIFQAAGGVEYRGFRRNFRLRIFFQAVIWIAQRRTGIDEG